MNQQNPKLQACIDAGATVDEFLYAASVAIEKNKGFNFLLGVVIKQRKEIAELGLHQGALPASQYQQSLDACAKAVFKPEYIAEQTRQTIEVSYDQTAITS